MGVKSGQKLFTYLMVMVVASNREKYFKHSSSKSGVITVVGQLNDNERIEQIYEVCDDGTLTEMTVSFIDGKLQLIELTAI